MKTVLAVFVCFLVFLFTWLLLAGLLYAMAWAALQAGQKPGLLLLVHVFLMWVLSPAIGAGVGVYASSSGFRSVPAQHIFVSFVSVCAMLLAVLAVFGVASYARGGSTGGQLLIFIFQALAIIAGARVGRNAVRAAFGAEHAIRAS